MTLSRRTFVAWMAGALPVAIVARRADALAAAWLADDEATMRALAMAILPSELGADGAARVARDFQKWIDGYRENVEVVHGYGTSALEVTKPSPRAKWAAQLESLRKSGVSKEGIAKLLENERLDRIPDVASAPHVALGLLAFFYDSSEANDMCHEARIGRETCRPLSAASRRPLRLPTAAAGGAENP